MKTIEKNTEPALLNRTQACRLLGISDRLFGQLVANGDIVPLTLTTGGKWYSRARLLAMVRVKTSPKRKEA